MDSGIIMIVDDDPVVSGMLREVLCNEGHQVIELSSGEDVLTYFESNEAAQLPDVIFLDIEMGNGIDGYDTCRCIRDNTVTSGIPIIFLSSHNELEDRLRAYDAGGSDFLPKPFINLEVCSKARVARRIVKRIQAHSEQTTEARYLASLMMANMDEIGYVMAFVRKLITYVSSQEIAEGMIDFSSQYALDAIVQTRINQISTTYSKAGIDIPLESSILNHLYRMDRIFEFRQRSVFNYDNVTLMINNMPLHDPDLCGRLRDHLCFAVEAADSRLRSVEIEQSNLRTSEVIRVTLARVSSAIESIEIRHRDERLSASDLMFKLDQSMTSSFMHLALTTSQERFLADLVNDFMKQLIAVFDRGDDTHLALSEIRQELGQWV